MDKQKLVMVLLVIIICVCIVVAAFKLINKEEEKPKGELPSTANQVIEGYQNLTEEEKENLKVQYNEIMVDGLDFDDLQKEVDIPQELRDYIYRPELTDPAKEFLGIE